MIAFIDPFGDIREVQKMRCLLKQGGLLHLGIPTGQDALIFNAHRVYGRLRLAIRRFYFRVLY